MTDHDALGFATRAIHATVRTPPIASEAIATPLYQTASFAFDRVEQMPAAIEQPVENFLYSRLSNPTVDALERVVADLEGAGGGVAFASGMAAIHGAIAFCCRAGDHVVAPVSMYGGTYGLLDQVMTRYGIETTFVPTADVAAAKAAMRPNTKLVWAETISNPFVAVADLAALAEVAHAGGARLVVDNTFASPYLCRPLTLGADLVVHSASKYLGGHGDLIGGIVLGGTDDLAAMRHLTTEIGGCMAPFVAWLLLRGVKTLSLRMRQHCASALALAQRLDRHPAVAWVRYPGLPSHPNHAYARDALPEGSGGILAVELRGGLEAVERFMNALEITKRAGSLGDAHSLALAPAATSHRQLSPEARKAAGISDGFVRVSVGLEDVGDLERDLVHALDV